MEKIPTIVGSTPTLLYLLHYFIFYANKKFSNFVRFRRLTVPTSKEKMIYFVGSYFS